MIRGSPAVARKKQSNGCARLTVRALSPEDWLTIETLFGKNGACGGCWCMWWRRPRGGKLWEKNKGANNKRAFKRLVTTGKVFGCLAFSENQPVGWCCVGPRADFPRLQRTKGLDTDWGEQTWAVTCFFIRAGWRHRGVATALLKEAVEVARANAAGELEAYPVRPKAGGAGEIPAAFAWTGVPRLFEKARFRNVTPPGNSRPVFRRTFRQRKGARSG